MGTQQVYLREDVQLEPLFNHWYAWSHLLSPATSAMNVANSIVTIMRSYVSNPEFHAAAVKNPLMRGGPFIDYDGKDVDKINELLEQTLRSQAHMMELAGAIKSLSQTLETKALGHPLEPLYPLVPTALQGYVELTYDMRNKPAFRLIEGLLYRSGYYDPSMQAIALSVVTGDERAFAFSTPRLGDASHLIINVPFSDSAIDELFKMRRNPQPRDYLAESLRLNVQDNELFESFLTDKTPPKEPEYRGQEIRIRYFGHACVLFEWKGVSILTDPLISYRYDSPSFRYTHGDLPEKLDYVVITHSHADHFVLEALLQLRHKIGYVVVPRNGTGAVQDPSLKLALEHTGFRNVIELDEMETLELPKGGITALPFLGEHADLDIRTKAAYLFRLGDRSVICAADSSNLDPDLYRHVHSSVGDVDILFLGMECDGAPLSWIYGPLLTKPLARPMDQSRRLSGSDFTRAIRIVEDLNCKQVFVYAMGQEPWLGFITSIKYTEESKPIVESNKLLRSCASRGIPCERLYGYKEIFSSPW